MLISHIPGNRPLYVDKGTLVCGTSMVFSPRMDRGILPIPFDPDLEWLEEEQCRTLTRSVRDGELHFDFITPPEVVGHIARQAIALNLLHSANYFHFLIEWLPSLNALLQQGEVGPDAMIVTGLLHVNFTHLLRVLPGGDRIPVLQLRHLQAVTCDSVLLPAPSYRCLELQAGSITEAKFDAEKLRLLRRTLAQGWPEPEQSQKLFVRRERGLRNIVNRLEVEALATAAGYKIVDPGAYPLPDQVRMFREATHIVGPTGAWVANLIYAREGAKVGVFYPETVRTEISPWANLGAVFGHEIADVYCPVPEILQTHPIHSDFIVPLDEAEALFRR